MDFVVTADITLGCAVNRKSARTKYVWRRLSVWVPMRLLSPSKPEPDRRGPFGQFFPHYRDMTRLRIEEPASLPIATHCKRRWPGAIDTSLQPRYGYMQ